MWRIRTYRGAMAEPPDRRAWAAADRQGARPGTAAGMPAVPRKRAGGGVDQVEGDELNLPLAQESWAYSSSPAAASMGRKLSSKVRESEKYQLKSWWSPIRCRVGATTIRTG